MRLMEDLQASIVTQHLFSQMVLNASDMEEAESCQTDHNRAKYILDHLLFRGTEQDYRKFKQVLCDTGQRHLALLLDDSQGYDMLMCRGKRPYSPPPPHTPLQQRLLPILLSYSHLFSPLIVVL